MRTWRTSTAHDRPSFLILDALWNSGGILSICQAVLLEGTRSRETRISLLQAMQFILTIRTELTSAANRRNPLDTSTVTDLPPAAHVIANGNDDACAFVTGNALCCLSHQYTKSCPLIMNWGFVAAT
jgi:hypothetical protein